MFRINSLELKLEIVKLVRENCELIVESGCDRQFAWVKEMLTAINEFLFQKLVDTRDIKTLINRILPEVCECFSLFIKGLFKGFAFFDNFLNELFETY
jgi:hypothetical protein